MARPKSTKGKTTSTKKPAAKAKAGTIKMLSANNKTMRRPPNNPEVPQNTIDNLNNELNQIKNILDDYAAHLRALDRKRLNEMGIHKLGFIERAYKLALENGEFFPHYLNLDRFGIDIQYFLDFRSLVDLTDQIREKLWNITVQSADMAYTDALEFYVSVREASCQKARGFLAGVCAMRKLHTLIRGVLPKAKLLSYPAQPDSPPPKHYTRHCQYSSNITEAKQKNPPRRKQNAISIPSCTENITASW
jgi:hypothetical protein